MTDFFSDQKTETLQEVNKRDPIFHIQNIQGIKTLEPYQKKIIKAVAKYDRTAIKSCHDMGKTFTLAKLVLWFGSSFPNSKIISTAPTFNQVKRLLWSEIRSGWRKSKYPLGGDMLTTEWKITEEWFAVGFTSRGDSDSQEGQGTASSFQGIHAPHILIVFDESTGIPRNIWSQVEGMLTSAHVKFVAVGNPTSRQCEFFKCFKDPMWHKMALTCFDSPNLIASGITDMEALKDELFKIREMNDEEVQARFKSYKVVSPALLSTSWVMAMAIKWGLEHPLFVSKVLGDFPEEDENVMITLASVEESQYRHETMTEKGNRPIPYCRSIGVDPARYGSDDTVVTVLEDNYQTLKKTMPKVDRGHKDDPAIQTVSFLTGYLKSLPRCAREVVTVDGTGIGAGIITAWKLAHQDPDNVSLKNVVMKEIHFGAQCDDPKDKEYFANIKAKMFKRLADSLKDDLAIQPENVYLEELPMIIYGFTPKGQLIIESKDDYKIRTGLGSPDSSDSLALANFGRVDTGRTGEFSAKMVEKSTKQRTLAPGLGGGSNW